MKKSQKSIMKYEKSLFWSANKSIKCENVAKNVIIQKHERIKIWEKLYEMSEKQENFLKSVKILKILPKREKPKNMKNVKNLRKLWNIWEKV